MTHLAHRPIATGPGAEMETIAGQDAPAGGERLVRVYAGKLFDPYALKLLPRRVVTVSQARGLVLDVQPYTDQELGGADFSGAHAVDLSEATVLPGFVDAHVHSESVLVDSRLALMRWCGPPGSSPSR